MNVLEEYRENQRNQYIVPMQALLDEFNLEMGKRIELDCSLGPPSQPAADPATVSYRLCDGNARGAPRTLTILICEFGYEEHGAGNWRFSPEDGKHIKSAIESFWDGSNNERRGIVDIPIS